MGYAALLMVLEWNFKKNIRDAKALYIHKYRVSMAILTK